MTPVPEFASTGGFGAAFIMMLALGRFIRNRRTKITPAQV